MDWDDNFNIDLLKNTSETSTEWNLRKMFIMRYRSQYKSEKLLSMAQTYSNIEFLGCNYPKSIMINIRQLTSSFEKVKLSSNIKIKCVKSQHKKPKMQLYTGSDNQRS